jgi:UDP-glucuronate 4-epimerase
VVHLAARAGVRPSIAQPHLYQDVNVKGTLVLLEACRKTGVKRFIFGSSSSVYGNNQKVPFGESDPVDQPISPYAASKRAGELFCHTYHHLHDMNITCLRYFTVYGPRQRPDLSIHKFAGLMEAGRPIPVFGDGLMQRDFTYIDDIVDGTVRSIERCAGFHVYNLGGSHPVSVSELIAALEDALQKKAVIERLPLQPGDVERTFADIRLARQELAWEPKIGLCEGLARFVRWFRGGGTARAAVRARRAS